MITKAYEEMDVYEWEDTNSDVKNVVLVGD